MSRKQGRLPSRSSLASSSPALQTPSSSAASTPSSQNPKHSANVTDNSDIEVVTPTSHPSKQCKQAGQTTAQRARDFKDTFCEGSTDEEILGILFSCAYSPQIDALSSYAVCLLDFPILYPLYYATDYGCL
jgi:hypothetical protein